MKKRIILVTGLAGWIGGLGTMVAVGSCDTVCEPDNQPSVFAELVPMKTDYDIQMNARDVHVRYRIAGDGDDIRAGIDAEPLWKSGRCLDDHCTTWGLGFDEPGHYEIEAEVCGDVFKSSADVKLGPDGCHAEAVAVDIPITGTICGNDKDPPSADPTPAPDIPCMEVDVPSVWVNPVRRYDDHAATVDVERVFFQAEGVREKQSATCVPDPDGGCTGWIAGYGVSGKITVSTEYCDTEVEQTVMVPVGADGCGVETQRIQLEVSTIGCMTEETEDSTPPLGSGKQMHG